MATFDELARQGCKVNGHGLLPWLDRFATEAMAGDFVRWDETKRTSWPGGPERTDDAVCVLRRRADGKPAYLIIEAETEPRADRLARLGIYELLLAMEVRGVLEEGPPIYGVVLHLTGSRKRGPLMLTHSKTEPGVLVKPIEVWLADVSAADTLALILAGDLDACILVWIVLMKGGGDPGLIGDWKQAVMQREPDEDKRALYRFFALALAELIPELVNWQSALGGWQVRESQYVKTIETRGNQQGKLEQARAYLIRILQAHLKTSAPEPIRLAIEGTNDLNTLDRWLDAVLTATSWAGFEAVMKRG